MDGESDGLSEIVSITTCESMSESGEVMMSRDANFNGTHAHKGSPANARVVA